MLRFAFENHKSFRNEVDLTMVLPTLRTNIPKEGTWVENTTRVAAIYGANASGKSGVLDALRYMQTVVAESAAGWARRGRLPRAPFLLDDDSKNEPSTFDLDFVLNDVRHSYGFSLSSDQIEEEWLYTFPTGRKRVIYERSAGGKDFKFGREIGRGSSELARIASSRALVLSVGSLIKHEILAPVYDAIVEGIDVATFGEQKSRLRSVVEDVADGTLAMDDLRTMLRVADIGIEDAEVEEAEMDPSFPKLLQAVMSIDRDPEGDDDDAESAPELDDEEVERIFMQVARSLKFRHVGAGEKTYPLPTSDQSTGTLTWLSIAAPAIATLRRGGVLAVDEIDASLHPQLAQVMIMMFRDETVNKHGAQLIFTTHDTYFLSPVSDAKLNPAEVWFVEKRRDGVSDLYRLSDFQTRADHNLSRRYLQGRYGAVPSVAPAFLASVANSPADGV